MTDSTSRYHLAQINVGHARYPMDDPRMVGFVSKLDEINQLAERTAGFVWRLQSESGNATDILTTPDPRFIINMSVWENIESLFGYVYKSDHTGFIGMRRHWFEPATSPIQTLWWIEKGQLPTPQEGLSRLEHLKTHGPTATAFSFKQRFLPDGRKAVN